MLVLVEVWNVIFSDVEKSYGQRTMYVYIYIYIEKSCIILFVFVSIMISALRSLSSAYCLFCC